MKDLSVVPIVNSVEEEYYTPNGEITFNKELSLYTVWDETYSNIVGTTFYPKVAEAMLDAYCKVYLDGEQSAEKEKEAAQSGTEVYIPIQ